MENIALVTIKVPFQPPQKPMKPSKPSRPAKMVAMSVAAATQSISAARASSTQSRNPSLGKGSSDPPSLGVKVLSAGLAACWADLITFPLDTAKVRLQIQGEGTLAAVAATAAASRSGSTTLGKATVSAATQSYKYRGIVGTLCTISREEGPRALYNGLAPGLQRQMAFASVRIGLYDTVKQAYINLFNANGTVSSNNVGLRILAGITTGAAAVTCAQPTDVVKVRMQAAGKGPKRYRGCVDAYRTIAAKEGIKGLWKGMMPNIARNAIINAAELVSYDMIKEAIVKRQLLSDNMPCHFLSAFGAGFIATVVASPVDVVKTRYMNSASGTYTGALQCAGKMYREGGLRAFYKGFMPSFVRLGSWNIVMFVTFEQLKRFLQDSNRLRELKDSGLAQIKTDHSLQTALKKFI